MWWAVRVVGSGRDYIRWFNCSMHLFTDWNWRRQVFMVFRFCKGPFVPVRNPGSQAYDLLPSWFHMERYKDRWRNEIYWYNRNFTWALRQQTSTSLPHKYIDNSCCFSYPTVVMVTNAHQNPSDDPLPKEDGNSRSPECISWRGYKFSFRSSLYGLNCFY